MKNLSILEKIVKEKLGHEPTGHDYTHAMRVYQNAKHILKTEKANKDIVLACSLVHDLIDHKLEEKYKISRLELSKWLENAGFDTLESEKVLFIIENMSYSKHQKLSSIEGKIVQDADKLDALGAIGIARTFSFGGNHNRLIYNLENMDKTSVIHFYEKLFKLSELMHTDFAKKEAVRRTAYMKNFISEMQLEIGVDFNG